MAGKVAVNQVQLGDSATASQNFVLQTNVDGTMKLSRGNVGAIISDIFTVDANNKINLATPSSMVRVNTSNGYGSTNTKIARFTTTVTNQGTDITYVDSATLGASFTINTNGVYSISYSSATTVVSDMAISLNSASLTTNSGALTANEVLCYATVGANIGNSTCWVGYLGSTSVVRPHTSGSTQALSNLHSFTITRVA